MYHSIVVYDDDLPLFVNLCFVSTSSQLIAAFRRPVDRNLQRILWITPCWRLRDSSDGLSYSKGRATNRPPEAYR